MEIKNSDTSSTWRYSTPTEYIDERNSKISEETIPIKLEGNAFIQEEEIEYSKTIFSKQFCVQFIISFIVSLANFIFGNHLGWIGPTILKLSSNTSEIPLNESEISWLAAMIPLGGAFGPILGGIFAGLIGRKKAILLTTVPEIITWIVIACTKNSYYLCIAEFIKGVLGGWTLVVVPMYIAEISSPNFRGVNGMIMSTLLQLGTFAEIVLVPYVSVAENAWIAAVIPLILLISGFWIPESPYYYLIKHQPERASKSLRILQQNKNIHKQLEILKRNVDEEQNEVKRITEVFRVKNNRVSFCLCFFIFGMQHVIGLIALYSYGQIILEKTDFVISAQNCGIIIGAVGVIFGTVIYFIIDTKGRKPLLLFSLFLAMFSTFIIAVYFHLDHVNYEHINSFSFLPFTGLLLYQLALCVGVIPVTYLYLGELLSTNVKEVASIFLVSYASIMNSVLNKIYPSMCDIFGTHTVLYFYTLGCLLSGFIAYFYIPETKGKTLAEIQQQLKNY